LNLEDWREPAPADEAEEVELAGPGFAVLSTVYLREDVGLP
jgi:hypothetical protein